MRSIWIFSLVLLFGGVLAAQDETQAMRMSRLKLNESQLQLDESTVSRDKAEESFRQSQELFKKGLLSKIELAQAEESFLFARRDREKRAIDLERTRLAILNSALQISLTRASISRDEFDKRHVLLTIHNGSNAKKLIQGALDTSANELLTVENMNVRIRLEGKLIGRPFEQRIDRLRTGESKTVDFILQKETPTVDVEIAYGDTLLALPVYLEKESQEDRISIEPLPFSQDGELGNQTRYELGLERYSEEPRTYQLALRGLPAGFSYSFQDKEQGDSRVSSIRFAQGVTSKILTLLISLPKELPADSVGKTLPLYILILDRLGEQRLSAALIKNGGTTVTSKIYDSAKVSYTSIELIPRGRAEITLNATNLYIKIKMGEPISFACDLVNTGTVDLEGIRLGASTLPSGWSVAIAPEKIPLLRVAKNEKHTLQILPAPDVEPGDYEIKLKAKTLYDGREIASAEKVLRIQIEGKTNFIMGAILLMLLIGAVVGVAIMTIKISRR